ncbi:MAG TPA: 5'-methylthioadenosine/S-adenosylhomocysteine nucleosidase [Candidatus Binatia bacterium]|nr:5'-methylthioadenosine/S-adenosylhomocysteine nucleosidase [Candidatus Binatia bacterium]
MVSRLVTFVLALLVGAAPAAAATRGICGTASSGGTSRIVVLSAFPAELAPLVAAADVESTVEVDGRSYYLATLAGVRVVLGLTGIGMVNAANRTMSVITAFSPEAIVFSGVAGSRYNIGDVVVVAEWVEKSGGDPVPVNPALLALVRNAATSLPGSFETCATTVSNGEVCLPYTPAVVFGDLGTTDDPFNGNPLPCTPGGGDVFGCELPAPTAVADEVDDMETAVVATLAAQHGIPFVAMRAVSDGAGDPLGDRGFPTQFFDYYHLAAANGALVTRAVIADVARLAAQRRGICRLLARGRWGRAAARIDRLP